MTTHRVTGVTAASLMIVRGPLGTAADDFHNGADFGRQLADDDDDGDGAMTWMGPCGHVSPHKWAANQRDDGGNGYQRDINDAQDEKAEARKLEQNELLLLLQVPGVQVLFTLPSPRGCPNSLTRQLCDDFRWHASRYERDWSLSCCRVFWIGKAEWSWVSPLQNIMQTRESLLSVIIFATMSVSLTRTVLTAGRGRAVGGGGTVGVAVGSGAGD
ncbi:hypothetical protein BDZ89DRAFT_1047721 [Hymenopellis radicata]|nr:hypothetical protein BDZ89DRAFT_1047721 [Hymenopellis radicata]